MTFDEVNALLSPAGLIQSIMSVEERRYIWDCVQACAGEPVIEVGSAYGGTTILMALAGGCPVWSVDDWSCGQRTVFEENIRSVPDAWVCVVAARSEAVADQFGDGTFGVVLVDGDHTGDAPYRDLVLYAPKVRPGGWLLIDDTNNGHPAITAAVARWRREQTDFVFDRVLMMEDTTQPKLMGWRRV